jgi:hypothetical protein
MYFDVIAIASKFDKHDVDQIKINQTNVNLLE